MKQLPLILSIAALAGVIMLAVTTRTGKGSESMSNLLSADSVDRHTHGQIGYFEMDSIEQHYAYIKEVRELLKAEEDNINRELNGMKKSYMSRIQQLQSKAPNMSQQEGESAQAEINQMQVNLQQKEARLAQDLQEKQFKMMQDINNKIMEFLKGYNAKKKFAYIISHQPGDFIYFNDSTFDITSDLIKGLNDTYKSPEQK